MIGSLLKVAAVATVFGYSVAARWLLNSRACMLVLCASALPFFALLGPHVLLFEIQPRYALPLWILPPLSSWLVYRYLHILSFSR
jgi:hypothetical protein